MQISPNELMKLIAETEKRTGEAWRLKFQEEKQQKANNKKFLIKCGVAYEFHDILKGLSLKTVNIVMTDKACAPITILIKELNLIYSHEDVVFEYNPVTLSYDGYMVTSSDGKILKYQLKHIHDYIIEKLEI